MGYLINGNVMNHALYERLLGAARRREAAQAKRRVKLSRAIAATRRDFGDSEADLFGAVWRAKDDDMDPGASDAATCSPWTGGAEASCRFACRTASREPTATHTHPRTTKVYTREKKKLVS